MREIRTGVIAGATAAVLLLGVEALKPDEHEHVVEHSEDIENSGGCIVKPGVDTSETAQELFNRSIDAGIRMCGEINSDSGISIAGRVLQHFFESED